MIKSKHLLVNINTSLLVLLLWLFCVPLSCSAAEKTYWMTEEQLIELETNLNELKKQNQILQEQLTQSKAQLENSKKELVELKIQSTTLKKQVQSLTTSLESAKASLNKYEDSQQNKNYAVGLGISNNSLAMNADINNIWLFADSNIISIGYKIKF